MNTTGFLVYICSCMRKKDHAGAPEHWDAALPLNAPVPVW